MSGPKVTTPHSACKPAIGLIVIDLSIGMAAALVVRMLKDAGADITCIPPPGGDPFFTVYPAYRHWKSGASLGCADELDLLVADADICLVGGETYPGLDWQHDAQRLSGLNPRLVVVDIGTLHGTPAVDMLIQAQLGLVHEQLSDRPVYIAARTPTYGAALSAQLGLWAALIERRTSGQGQIVSTTLEQGAAMFWSQIWMEATRPSEDFERLPPRDVRHLIFECLEGGWIQFVLGVPGALSKIYSILGIARQVSATDRGVPSASRGPADYFAESGVLADAIARWRRDALVTALRTAGIAAEPALRPGESWTDPQVIHSGLIRRAPEGECSVASVIGLQRRPDSCRDQSHRHKSLPAAQVSDGAPLAGLRIVDFGNFIAGPFASKLLADLGADVIKVEPPTGLANLTGLRNTWSSNRGKRSIIVDLKSPASAVVVNRLCESADVAHHNFRPGVAQRLHVDPESLQRVRSDIVTLETSAYGSSGPKSSEPGWDMVMQALCGHEVRAGGEGNPPMWYRSAIVDYATGALGAIAILMAVFEHCRTGDAVTANVSLLGAATFMLSELVQISSGEFVGAPLLNAERTGFHPAERLYATNDGWIAIAANSEETAFALARTLHLTHFPRRADWREEHAHAIAEVLARLSTRDALAQLAQAGVWTANCTREAWEHLREDGEARQRGLVIEVLDSAFGTITGSFGAFMSFSRSSCTAPLLRSAPSPGANTREILEEIGLGEQADGLFMNGVVA